MRTYCESSTSYPESWFCVDSIRCWADKAQSCQRVDLQIRESKSREPGWSADRPRPGSSFHPDCQTWGTAWRETTRRGSTSGQEFWPSFLRVGKLFSGKSLVVRGLRPPFWSLLFSFKGLSFKIKLSTQIIQNLSLKFRLWKASLLLTMRVRPKRPKNDSNDLLSH